VGSGVGSADADVVQASGDAQGGGAAVVDTVGTYSAVGVEAFAGAGFGPGGVGGRGGGGVGQRAVGSAVVVLLNEVVDLVLQLGECGRAWQGDEMLLRVWWNTPCRRWSDGWVWS
jgi:hypothetical protein